VHNFKTITDRKPRIHFSGIGGTAMVAGARLAIEAGWEVRGSDNPLYPPTSQMVAELGVPVAVGYSASNLDWDPDYVVIGNALSRGNPEVEAALDRKLYYISLPEWLREMVLRARRPVMIAGTHGKTTTTALAAWLLDAAGVNPGFFIGGQPLNFPFSARLGAEGAPFVIEGDEYDTAFFDKRAKFFHYMPEIAIVTSVEFDHGDIYPSLEDIEKAFRWMLRQIPRSGWLVTCADHPGSLALKARAYCNVMTYGLGESADLRGEIGASQGGLQELIVYKQGTRWGRFEVPLAGRHNMLNTLGALAAGDLLGLGPETLGRALRDFRGVKRRMEIFHTGRGVTFVDDFAHHPTAIRETIAAARMRWPAHRLWALFEPRSNTTVGNRFQVELRDSFLDADRVWVGPIHRADTIPEERRLSREVLVRELNQITGKCARFTDEVKEIVEDLETRAAKDDIVLILSNGAFGGIYDTIRKAFH
jgi:UDP-N-acetylmuramate: L-alanyl-gamma-D-glutamyl-meso-diaminopimelate ligase